MTHINPYEDFFELPVVFVEDVLESSRYLDRYLFVAMHDSRDSGCERANSRGVLVVSLPRMHADW